MVCKLLLIGTLPYPLVIAALVSFHLLFPQLFSFFLFFITAKFSHFYLKAPHLALINLLYCNFSGSVLC